jgi:luciferase family oxidoreductase group 1
MPVFSILDLAPITQGSTAADALHNARSLAQHAEGWGYQRYWLAEHHNMIGIASAATAVCVGYVAEGTKTIRVGAGGIMLPNHSPMVIAEQFGTLASLYPGRIDLGLGRAPGSDGRTQHALRRDPMASDTFPQDVVELQALLAPDRPNQAVRAVPGVGTEVPLWILGSSLFGAQLAGMLGLPFAFASHFAPDALLQALQVYRSRFAPSKQLEQPHAMVGCNVVVADTDAEAAFLFTSTQQRFVDMHRNQRGKLAPPIPTMDTYWSASEKMQASAMLACSFVGSPDTVRRGLEGFLAQTGANELMIGSAIFEHSARLRSYELLAQLRDAIPQAKLAA